MAALADRGWILYTCCLVLSFLISCVTASRFPTALAPVFQKGSAAQFDATKLNFRAELIHRDHPDSPLRPPPGTDRLAAAAARSKARGAARRRLAAGSEVADATPIAPGSEEYLMTIHLGTPPQKFVMIVDSGSDLVWVQCLPCNAPNVCFPSPNPYFDPSASSSYATVPCNSSQCDPLQFNGIPTCDSSRSCYISYAYVDGSGIAGELSTETLAVSNSINGVPLKLESFLFGCMNNDTVSFGSSGVVDGLAGFGRGPNSLPSQLTQATVNNVFSYCLVPYTAATVLTSSLLLGLPGVLPLVHTPVLTYDETFYWVNMTGISVNGSDLGIPSSTFQFNVTTRARGAIFDSGTNILVLMPNILTPVVKAFKGLIKYPEVNSTDYPLCYNVTGVTHPKFPSMSLHFSGSNGTTVEFPLTKENLFIPASDNAPEIECLAMESTGDDDNGNIIVGNIAQANHYIEYDVTNLQLGWTPSFDCSKVEL